MLQADWQTAADLNLFTDASGTLGFGATCEQLPDCHSRLLSSSSAIGCPMWPLLR